MRNSKDITATAGDLYLSVVGSTVDSNSLRNGAAQMLVAPTSLNGCISEISFDTIGGRKQDYAAAMKNYGLVYEEYQSYLMPTEPLPAHDYDIAMRPVPAFSHLGCLNADLLESTVHTDQVSDDDIERCGYMAWVH